MAGPSSPGQGGPDDVPPPLPEGWLAQWDGGSRKYYYVQRATGYSQWEVPTKPALSAPTPEPTPQGVDPFGKPIDTKPAPDAEYTGQDRSLLGDLAMGALGSGGGNKQSNHSSTLGGLAQNLLGSSKPSGGQTPTNMGGQLLNAFLGANKPHGQSIPSGDQGQGAQGPVGQTAHGASGLIGGLLHGHSGQQQDPNFGYNPGQSSGAAYSGQAPTSTYTPALHAGAYGPSSGPYQPLGTNNQYNPGSQPQLSKPATNSSSPYQSQATPQPFNTPQTPHGQQFQGSHSAQFQSSHPPTPSFGQQSSAYSSQLSPTSLGQYGQHHSQHTAHQIGQHQGFHGPPGSQDPSNNYPPPPSQSQTQNYATTATSNTGTQSFPTSSSGQSQPLYPPQQSQQQQPQHGSLQNFPPPPGPQFGQPNIPVRASYAPPPGNQSSHNQSITSSQHPSYANSPAPPVHNHPTHQGYSNVGSSHNNHNTAYPHQASPADYANQSQDSYVQNYAGPPPAPSWR